ncbi:right-handed parallel beta-helix repeat-containing protein [Candidatus Uhrbacteria bacterium]|nr:right-handed parallel beta-helix repeat-containing protein [Candidatus Uhrbacteria bacterium]
MSKTFLNKKNNAKSTLASGITSGATSLSVQTGDGAKFPSAPFQVTLYSSDPASGEIVKVTTVSTDTFTITRAQEGTTAQAWNAGDKVELLVTAKLFDDFQTRTEIIVATDGSGDYNTDGVSDESEINEAISNLPSGGGVVLLKKGTYTIGGNINILKNNVTLRGEGKSTKITLANSTNVDMIQVGNGTTIVNDCVVEDLQVDGNKANQTSLGSAVVIYGSSGTKALRNIVRGCRLTNCYLDCLKLIYADKSIIENNTIDENTSGSGIGIFSSSQTNDIIGNVLIHNAYGVYSNSHYNNVVGNVFIDNTSYGVYLNGVVNFNVSGNWFGSVSYFQTGIYLAASTARTAITGNSFYQPYRAIFGAADANVIGNTITGNSIYLANQEAIYLQAGANQNAIVGNTIRATSQHAIRIRGSKNIISSNMLIDNGQGTNNTYSDIFLDDNGATYSTYNTVIGNNCQAAAANKVAYHIRENGTSDDFNLVIGNVCKDAVTAQISLQGANSVRGTNIPATG